MTQSTRRGGARRIDVIRWFCSLCLAGLLGGCEDSGQEFDHVPAAGMGSLIIDNNSGTEFGVFVDGFLTNSVDSSDDAIVDMAPGKHRVVLDQDHGDRSYANDIDILEGRQTILRVFIDGSSFLNYVVVIEFDK